MKKGEVDLASFLAFLEDCNTTDVLGFPTREMQNFAAHGIFREILF